MINFAQNFEDVILARIFHDRRTGFYVDVGAHYPLIDSVTEHFYRLGWRGINIEPLPSAFEELSRTRTHDVNLNFAIAEEEGEVEFFALDGLSTLNKEVASRHGEAGLSPRRMITQTRRLASVLQEYPAARIDFLKIDVEGTEGGVIRSNDWNRFRPIVLLIEVIDPNTQALRHVEWEEIILGAGYQIVHFDGVNRWYYNSDFPKPDPCCFLPPNALDGFTPFPQLAAESRAATVTRESAYEREHARLRIGKMVEALSALAAGDYSKPSPDPSLLDSWSSLQELIRSATDGLSADTALSNARLEIEERRSQLTLSEENAKREIGELRSRLALSEENAKREIGELRSRLALSEKSRFVLVEALASRGIAV